MRRSTVLELHNRKNNSVSQSVANVEEDINESARSGDKFDQIQAAAGQAQLSSAHRNTKKHSRGLGNE